MALVVGDDVQGDYAVMECERLRCYSYVMARPGSLPATAYDLACEAFDLAEAAGWALEGRTYCPRHAPRRLERVASRPRGGDGYSWAETRVEGRQGPS